MKYIANAVHEKGLLAGLWLAPFSCARDSKVAKEHPEWLVKNSKGKPALGSIIWGAYIIDFYVKALIISRTYLTPYSTIGDSTL